MEDNIIEFVQNRPVDDYDIEKMSTFESLIAASCPDREEFFRLLKWLGDRLLLDAHPLAINDGKQLPDLSRKGEDTIELGLTVTDWYHGPYKRRHYEENTSCCGLYMGEGFDPDGES